DGITRVLQTSARGAAKVDPNSRDGAYWREMPPSLDLILANRAYMDHDAPRRADAPPQSASGGLLVGVRPVVEPWDGERGTTWIGAGLGSYDREWTDEQGFDILETPRGGLRHRRLYFDDAAWKQHYAG